MPDGARAPQAVLDGTIDESDATADLDGATVPWTSDAVLKRGATEPPDPSAKWLADGDAWLARAQNKRFEPLRDFSSLEDGISVRRDSERWTSLFLRPEANPYRSDLAVERSVHRATADTLDYLRHDYSISIPEEDGGIGTLHIIVIETIGDIRIVIERPKQRLLSLPLDARLEAIAWMADHVIQRKGVHQAYVGINEEQLAPHDFLFFYTSLEEGARFSTDRSKVVHQMWSWAERVDGGIAGGRLYFLGFKRVAPVLGRDIYLPKSHWFDGQAWEMHRKREERRYDFLRDR